MPSLPSRSDKRVAITIHSRAGCKHSGTFPDEILHPLSLQSLLHHAMCVSAPCADHRGWLFHGVYFHSLPALKSVLPPVRWG
ncbi:hypothetical protein MC885_013390, partial [Smutsia gigantea]